MRALICWICSKFSAAGRVGLISRRAWLAMPSMAAWLIPLAGCSPTPSTVTRAICRVAAADAPAWVSADCAQLVWVQASAVNDRLNSAAGSGRGARRKERGRVRRPGRCIGELFLLVHTGRLDKIAGT
ncbi:hypothetical protein D3C81_1459810 [compost metagenome]